MTFNRQKTSTTDLLVDTRVWIVGLMVCPFLVTPSLAKEQTITSSISSASRANALDTSLLDAFESVVGCSFAGPQLTSDLTPVTTYAATAGNCEIVTDIADSSETTLFTDENCSESFAYERTSFPSYCARTMNPESLGNAADLELEPSRTWTLSQGTLFDFGALSLDGLNQPYMTRVKYKSVATDGGTCDLEMRIYKQDPNQPDLKSLIAFHGGSWTSRGFGFFGTEMTVPQYTNAGYVVFAPFYRLLDEKEGGAACHNASIEEITEDANDALQWVIDNAESWGGNNYPVVFGQSAGAHLAASLAVNHPEQVSNAVLFYPPTDFTDFAMEVQNGNYVNEQGLDILERVIGGSFETANISASPIVENSFPAIVETNPERYPPMFMLHGLADDLVEARQSIRLCGALSGSAGDTFDIAALESAVDLRQVLSCDQRGSEVHLIKEGGHALDVCLVGLLPDACPSGSPASVAVVSASIESSVSWATEISDQRLDALNSQGNSTDGETTDGSTTDGDSTDGGSSDDGGSGGGGALGWWVALLGLVIPIRRIFSRSPG